MRKMAEMLILLLQLAGVVTVGLGLWWVWPPLALLFAGSCFFWLGRRLWQQLENTEQEDGYR